MILLWGDRKKTQIFIFSLWKRSGRWCTVAGHFSLIALFPYPYQVSFREWVRSNVLPSRQWRPAMVGRYLLWQPCHGRLWHPASPSSFTRAGLCPFRKHVSFILTDHCVRFLCPANKDSGLYAIIYLNAHTHIPRMVHVRKGVLFRGNHPERQQFANKVLYI